MWQNNNCIDDKDVLSITYPKNKNANNKYGAVGICKIALDKTDARNTDKCAFSQFKLSECDSISALICSKNDNSINGKLGNKWNFLCDSDFNKVHLFDTNYLKQWVKIKGCEYIHCPLCKTGIIEEKQQIEEHDIDTMEQLKEKLIESKNQNDLFMTFYIEQLIFDKICNEINININSNKKILNDVLTHWESQKKINEFKDKITESTKKCIEKDNVKILEIILIKLYCYYNNEEIIEFINNAAKYGAFDCISLLLKYPEKIDWGSQKRPILLLNAIKYHHENTEMILFIIQKLETLKISFVCDDIMEEIIKFDLVEIAKHIVNNRWHKITEKDELLAQQIDLDCNVYFKQRSNASNYNQINWNDDNDEEQINWNDDEWENEDDDDFDDDGDDWQNADD